MADVTVQENVSIWMAVVVGVFTALATAYGMYRAWQQRRQDSVQRLTHAAQLAVRRTESAYVRPILCERLEACLVRFATAHRRVLQDGDADDILRTRFLLFCELQRTVRLTDDEKRTAQGLAIDRVALWCMCVCVCVIMATHATPTSS